VLRRCCRRGLLVTNEKPRPIEPGLPKAAGSKTPRLCRLGIRASYCPFEHVFAASSHFIPAFSQSALFVGASAANVGTTKEIARPKATSIVTRLFMGILPGEFCRKPASTTLRDNLGHGRGLTMVTLPLFWGRLADSSDFAISHAASPLLAHCRH